MIGFSSFAINASADLRRATITEAISGNYLLASGIVIAIVVAVSFAIIFSMKKGSEERGA